MATANFAEIFAHCNQTALEAIYHKSEAVGNLPPEGGYTIKGLKVEGGVYEDKKKEGASFPLVMMHFQVVTAEDSKWNGQTFVSYYRCGQTFQDGSSGPVMELRAMAELLLGPDARNLPFVPLLEALAELVPDRVFTARVAEKKGFKNLRINGVVKN